MVGEAGRVYSPILGFDLRGRDDTRYPKNEHTPWQKPEGSGRDGPRYPQNNTPHVNLTDGAGRRNTPSVKTNTIPCESDGQVSRNLEEQRVLEEITT